MKFLFIHFSPKLYAYLKLNKIRKSNDFSGFLYGRKLPNGTWTGLVGALATGDIDLVKLTSFKQNFLLSKTYNILNTYYLIHFVKNNIY